jgi:integrase
MAKVNLTDRKLRSLKKARQGQRYDVADAAVAGLAARVTDQGTVTFVLVARYPGGSNPTRRAIGTYPSTGLAEARETARDWLKLIRQGVDPRREIERMEAAQARKRAATFRAVAEDFIREKLPSERKGAVVARDIRREFMPLWGDRPIADITAHDVRELIRGVAARAPYQAHNLLGHARRLFSWAIDQHVYGLEASPCDRLKPKAIIGEKAARRRVLSDDEIRAFWRGALRLPYPYGPCLRVLLLTGQRHNEIAHASWHEINAAGDLLAIGAERFKSEADHIVPLVDDVQAILATLPKFKSGGFLFSTTYGRQPTIISDKIKKKLDARMLRTLRAMARLRGEEVTRVELKPWVIHDLRRTVRTHLAALRVQDHVAEMVLGHGRQGLQRIYDQHRYIEEIREALILWASWLRSILSPAAGNVVALKRAS